MTGQEALNIGKVGDKVLFNDGVRAEIQQTADGGKILMLTHYPSGKPFDREAKGFLNYQCEFVKEKEKSMITVNYLKKEQEKKLTTQDMKVGDVAIVYLEYYGEVLLLRIFADTGLDKPTGFVNLKDPMKTWYSDLDKPIIRMVDVEINVLN